jgi:ribonucleoside-diphosphate reductase beta chain
MEIINVQKRNGDIKAFDIQKIVKAIYNAMRESDAGDRSDAERITELVYQELLQRGEMNPNYMPNIEEIQDIVEEALMVGGYF